MSLTQLSPITRIIDQLKKETSGSPSQSIHRQTANSTLSLSQSIRDTLDLYPEQVEELADGKRLFLSIGRLRHNAIVLTNSGSKLVADIDQLAKDVLGSFSVETRTRIYPAVKNTMGDLHYAPTQSLAILSDAIDQEDTDTINTIVRALFDSGLASCSNRALYLAPSLASEIEDSHFACILTHLQTTKQKLNSLHMPHCPKLSCDSMNQLLEIYPSLQLLGDEANDSSYAWGSDSDVSIVTPLGTYDMRGNLQLLKRSQTQPEIIGGSVVFETCFGSESAWKQLFRLLRVITPIHSRIPEQLEAKLNCPLAKVSLIDYLPGDYVGEIKSPRSSSSFLVSLLEAPSAADPRSALLEMSSLLEGSNPTDAPSREVLRVLHMIHKEALNVLDPKNADEEDIALEIILALSELAFWSDAFVALDSSDITRRAIWQTTSQATELMMSQTANETLNLHWAHLEQLLLCTSMRAEPLLKLLVESVADGQTLVADTMVEVLSRGHLFINDEGLMTFSDDLRNTITDEQMAVLMDTVVSSFSKLEAIDLPHAPHLTSATLDKLLDLEGNLRLLGDEGVLQGGYAWAGDTRICLSDEQEIRFSRRILDRGSKITHFEDPDSSSIDMSHTDLVACRNFLAYLCTGEQPTEQEFRAMAPTLAPFFTKEFIEANVQGLASSMETIAETGITSKHEVNAVLDSAELAWLLDSDDLHCACDDTLSMLAMGRHPMEKSGAKTERAGALIKDFNILALIAEFGQNQRLEHPHFEFKKWLRNDWSSIQQSDWVKLLKTQNPQVSCINFPSSSFTKGCSSDLKKALDEVKATLQREWIEIEIGTSNA